MAGAQGAAVSQTSESRKRRKVRKVRKVRKSSHPPSRARGKWAGSKNYTDCGGIDSRFVAIANTEKAEPFLTLPKKSIMTDHIYIFNLFRFRQFKRPFYHHAILESSRCNRFSTLEHTPCSTAFNVFPFAGTQ